MKKRIVALALLCLCLFPVLPARADTPQRVMIVEVDDAVEQGLASYLERNLNRAAEQQADILILELDTPGGRVDAAQDIKRLLYQTDIETVALVKDQALSAGAYIALCCDKIAMMPGSTLGDAEMLVNGERADEKYLGPWREEFASIAEDKGRDPEIAKAFVDRDIEIPGVVEAGKLLTLTPQRALELGMADVLVEDREELLEWLGAADAQLIYSDMTAGERITRFLTHPNVAPILLAGGILCLIVELFTPGLGIPAVAGVVLLGLYFGGHLMAGMANWFALLLFIVGLILCFIEILTPGFGIFALSGIACIVGSIFLTTPDLLTAVKYLAVILAVVVIAVPILAKLFSKSRFLDRLMVRYRLTTDAGYVAGAEEQDSYVGRTGVAASMLRPAGIVELDDGTRLDVVTRGDYIEQGEPVRVIRREGTWLVVEQLRPEDAQTEGAQPARNGDSGESPAQGGDN